MAITKIHFSAGLPHGSLLRSTLTALEDGHDGLNDIVSCTQLMIDGDGSQASHFGEVMTRYGFTSLDFSKAAWEELLSVQSKLNTDGSVTNVLSALRQVAAKFR